jgi:hypothetical protein
MRQQTRIALEFVLPPLIASLPLASRVAFIESDYNRAVLVPMLIFTYYMGGCFPALFSTTILELAFKSGLSPKSVKAIGLSTLVGSVGAIMFAKMFLRGEHLVGVGLAACFGWASTGLIVSLVERKNSRVPNQSSDPTLSTGTPRAGHEPDRR